MLDRVRDAVAPGTLVVSATKGIENDTLALMSEVFAECLPQARFAALSGPSFALEVCQGQPTAVVAASRDEASALRRAAALRHADVPGVLGRGRDRRGAGGGAQERDRDRRGHPRGARDWGTTRARRSSPAGSPRSPGSGVAMGADPLTFAGLAGMGDLVLTDHRAA